MSDYSDGKRDYKAYQHSSQFYTLADHLDADDAIRLFRPPEEQTLLQMATPECEPRQEWKRGWRDGGSG